MDDEHSQRRAVRQVDPKLEDGVEGSASLANWQDGPFNRWSFQHVRELIPTARIAKGIVATTDLSRYQSSLEGLRLGPGCEGLNVLEMLEATYTDAFLVIHHGRILSEQYFNGMDPSTLHLLQSVSKSITSTIAGILVGGGQLAVTDPVTKYVEELRGTSFEGATVRQLLDMRTGTRFSEDYSDPESEVKQYEQVIGWAPRTSSSPDDDLHSFISELVNTRPHGGPFEYRSILTDLLGWVLERASSQRYADLVSQELWRKLGAEFDAEVTVDVHGNALADGGISATLRDVGRFGLMFLENGWANGRQIVPVEWVRDCWRGNEDSIAAFDPNTPLEQCLGGMYRNNWWVKDWERGVFYGSGVYGQAVFVHFPANVVMVKFSTWPDALDRRLSTLQLDGFMAIANALTDYRA